MKQIKRVIMVFMSLILIENISQIKSHTMKMFLKIRQYGDIV